MVVLGLNPVAGNGETSRVGLSPSNMVWAGKGPAVKEE